MTPTALPHHLGLQFDVPSDLDLELEWFLEKRHEPALAPVTFDPRDPDGLWRKTAYAAIASWLAAIDAYDADILRCAYAPADPRPASVAERRSPGRLTRVFARFARKEPGFPDAIDWRAAMHHARTAAEVFRAALREYARVRGGGPCVLTRVT